MNEKNQTIKELASKIGVSPTTISRVMNDSNKVKPATRDKVLQAIKAYGYIPNQIARSLKTSRKRAVGVIVPEIRDPFFANVVEGIAGVLSASGYTMLLSMTKEKADAERMSIEYMLSNMIDGVILSTTDNESEEHIRYLDVNRPIVYIHNLPRAIQHYCAVITDNERASDIAVRHLHALGHENIAIIAGKQTDSAGCSRLRGYKTAMEELRLGVAPGWIRCGMCTKQGGYEQMAALLRENPEITAVYANSAPMTYGAYKALKEAGRKIPEDISLMGFDVTDSGAIETDLTSIVQEDHEMGRIACKLLLDAVETQLKPIDQRVMLGAHLLERKSTCPPRNGI